MGGKETCKALVDRTHPEGDRDSATSGHYYSARGTLGSETGPILDVLAQQGLVCPTRRAYTQSGAE